MAKKKAKVAVKSSIPRTAVQVSAHTRSVIEHRAPAHQDIDKLMSQVYTYLEDSGETYVQFARRSGLSLNAVYRLVAEEVPPYGPAAKTIRRLLRAGVDVAWYAKKYYPKLYDDLDTSEAVGQLFELAIAFAGYDADPSEQRESQQRTLLLLGIGAKLARLERIDLEEAVSYMHGMLVAVADDEPVRIKDAAGAKSMQAALESAAQEFNLLPKTTKRPTRRAKQRTKRT